MGGVGSGTWCRSGKKQTTADCKRIDIRLMKRKGWLKPGCGGSLSWTLNGESWGDISYECYANSLKLDYRYRAPGGDWTAVQQTIEVTSTLCNYGKSRQWFLCPRCTYRCAILYGVSELFLCRKCYDLPYNSQMQSSFERLISQKHHLGERIFEVYEYGEGWLKRKGMHQRTFDRLYTKFRQIDERIDYGIFSKFGTQLI